jgi:hypothetical protein
MKKNDISAPVLTQNYFDSDTKHQSMHWFSVLIFNDSISCAKLQEADSLMREKSVLTGHPEKCFNRGTSLVSIM